MPNGRAWAGAVWAQPLSNKDGVYRQSARENLVAMGRAVTPILIQLLEHARSLVRWEAALALKEISDPAAGFFLWTPCVRFPALSEATEVGRDNPDTTTSEVPFPMRSRGPEFASCPSSEKTPLYTSAELARRLRQAAQKHP